jgi:hypothetical protein
MAGAVTAAGRVTVLRRMRMRRRLLRRMWMRRMGSWTLRDRCRRDQRIARDPAGELLDDCGERCTQTLRDARVRLRDGIA